MNVYGESQEGQMKKAEVRCEFCDEITWQSPDNAEWRFVNKKKRIIAFCSYLCAMRYFGLEKKTK